MAQGQGAGGPAVMALAKRIIPSLLCRGRTLVKGTAFDSWRSVGHAAQAVRIHQARGVDELLLLDITATAEGRGPDLGLVEELSQDCFMPISVGGGVRTLEHVRDLLKAGADKVVVNSAAIEDPHILRRIADAVGSQALVASIDVREGSVYGRCGQKLTKFHPVWWAMRCAARGAGEILLTSIEREGKLEGYDLQMVHDVSHAVGVPVIAAGGAGTYEHLLEALRIGADAVAVGAMFQFTDATPKGAAQYLAQAGVEVRL